MKWTYCIVLLTLVAGCLQKRPEQTQPEQLQAPIASQSSVSKIETEVEYRYLPGRDPRDGAPYYRIFATATSDHPLSETEMSSIRSALATHTPGRGPSKDINAYISQRNISGVTVGPPTYEDLHYTLEPKKENLQRAPGGDSLTHIIHDC